MATTGPGESSARRRKPAAWMIAVLIAVIAIVLLVLLL
jgi:predicted nucleic acid-binding Zn ribbon protein